MCSAYVTFPALAQNQRMELILYWLSAIVLLAFAVWISSLLARTGSMAAAFTLIVTLGLVYDNGVIAAGNLIGTGPLLEALNWPRYVIHAFATPLLVMVSLDLARRFGLRWAGQSGWRIAFWAFTVLLIGYGVVFELLPLSLVAENNDGIVSYGPAGGAGFPLPAIATMVPLIFIGIILWVKRGWAWLAVGSVLAVVGFGVAPALDFTVLGQIAEVALIGGITLSESHLASPRGHPAAARPLRAH